MMDIMSSRNLTKSEGWFYSMVLLRLVDVPTLLLGTLQTKEVCG